MSFKYNSTGIDPDAKAQNKVLPKRWFSYEIVEFIAKDGTVYPREGTSKNGDPQVVFLAEVIDDDGYKGERVMHTVTFLPPKGKDGKPSAGAGMAIHFLKTIGQPWEGEIEPEAEEWIGAKLDAYTLTEEYNGKTKNKFGEIRPYKELSPVQAALKAQGKSSDDVPY